MEERPVHIGEVVGSNPAPPSLAGYLWMEKIKISEKF